jgi:transmembrane sensor
MRQLDFISLIHKELTGDISAEESLQLKEWLKSDSGNLDTYEDIKAIWQSSTSYNAPFIPNVELAFQKQLERINSENVITPKVIRMKPMKWVSAVAASLLILLSALVIWNYSNDKFYSADDQIANIVLDDGTEVWLNKGAEITLSRDFNKENRKLTLKGEAYFDVQKNTDLPFIIDAGELSIKVLGTEFNVRSIDFTKRSVTVKEGRVQVSASDSEVVIAEGQYASLESDGALITGNILDQNELSWKDNILSFDDTPFNDAMDDLSSFFNIEINTSGIISDCPITYTKSVDTDLETALTVISKAYDMQWTTNPNGGFTVTSVSCD